MKLAIKSVKSAVSTKAKSLRRKQPIYGEATRERQEPSVDISEPVIDVSKPVIDVSEPAVDAAGSFLYASEWSADTSRNGDADLFGFPVIVDRGEGRSAENGKFKYRSLSTETKEIRVLDIIPGTRVEPVSCRLSHITLSESDRLPYETISYCWGHAATLGQISIDDVMVEIPLSSLKALRRVRLHYATRRVWIDAICIDQANVQEKARQINIMGDVYASSCGNLVDLGDGFPDLASAIRSVKILAKDMEEELAVSRDAFHAFLMYAPRANGHFLPAVDQMALASFFDCPWFRRLWVLQEVYLACSNSCLCGEEPAFELIDALRAAQWLSFKQHHIYTIRLDFHVGRAAAVGLWYLVENKYSFRARSPMTLCSMMHISKQLETSRPEDKVFGTIGLITRPVGNGCALLKVDYSRPLQDIYRDATRHAIYENGDLRSFNTLCHRSDWGLELEGFGSWVHRLDRPHDNRFDAVELGPSMPIKFRNFTAPERYVPPMHDADPRVLSVVGQNIDQVTLLSDVFRPSIWHEDDETFMKVLAQVCHMASEQFGSRDRVVRVETREARFPREAIFVMTVGHAHLDSTILETLGELFDFILSGQSMSSRAWPNGIVDGSLGEYGQVCEQRRFFITRRGHMGLAPRATQVGDFVVRCAGGYTPFMIREIDAVDRRKVQFIGEAYVEGFMKGQRPRQHEALGKEDTVWWIY